MTLVTLPAPIRTHSICIAESQTEGDQGGLWPAFIVRDRCRSFPLWQISTCVIFFLTLSCCLFCCSYELMSFDRTAYGSVGEKSPTGTWVPYQWLRHVLQQPLTTYRSSGRAGVWQSSDFENLTWQDLGLHCSSEQAGWGWTEQARG